MPLFPRQQDSSSRTYTNRSGKRRMMAAAVILFVLFIALLTAERLSLTQAFDVTVDRYLSTIRTGLGVQVMVFITTIFSPTGLFVYAGFLDIFLLSRRMYRSAGQLSGGLIIANLAMISIKTIVARKRPIFEITILHSFSFPSGHATTAAAFFGFLLMHYRGRPAAPLIRRLWMTGAWFMIALIGFTRLYLGFHYLSDVIGGFLLGFFWVFVWAIAFEGRFTPIAPEPK